MVSRLEWQLLSILLQEPMAPGSKMDAAKYCMFTFVERKRDREKKGESITLRINNDYNGIRGMRVDGQV
jgi:hypothetical protein